MAKAFVSGETLEVVFLGETDRHQALVVEGAFGHALLEFVEDVALPPTTMVGELRREGLAPEPGVLRATDRPRRVRFVAGAVARSDHARRRDARVEVTWDCHLARRNGRAWTGRITDISAGGMLVECSEPIDTNHVLKFTLTGDRPGDRIMGHATCTRRTPEGRYALQFGVLPPLAREQLADLLEEAAARARQGP